MDNRIVFAFGPSKDSYFCSSPNAWAWHALPQPLLQTLLAAPSPQDVIIGPDPSSWLVLPSPTAAPTFSPSLPPSLRALLASRPPPTHVSLGPGGSYHVAFADGSSASAGLPRALARWIERWEARGSTVQRVVLGAAGAVVLLSHGGVPDLGWTTGLPPGLVDVLQGAKEMRRRIRSVKLSLVDADDYFVQFEDDAVACTLVPRVMSPKPTKEQRSGFVAPPPTHHTKFMSLPSIRPRAASVI